MGEYDSSLNAPVDRECLPSQKDKQKLLREGRAKKKDYIQGNMDTTYDFLKTKKSTSQTTVEQHL